MKNNNRDLELETLDAGTQFSGKKDSEDSGSLQTYFYKPDWEFVRKRWDAFWSMEPVDRPCISIVAPRTEGRKIQLPEIKSLEDK